MKQTTRYNGKSQQDPRPAVWNLRLYIAGETSRSIAALGSPQRICDEQLAAKYQVEVIDLMKNPQLAAGDQIIAVPTLVRRLAPPMKKRIGDSINTQPVLGGSI
jgi:circadian clock protein KaiB